MTQLRIKLLVALVAALTAADVASAQSINIGGRNGVTLGTGAQPYYGGGYGAQPYYGGGYSGSPYYNGSYNGSPTYRGGYPGWSGYNQPAVTTMPGRNYFPAAGGYYSNPNPTYYTTPNGVIQSSGYTTNNSGVVQSGGFTYPQQTNSGVMQASGFSSQQDTSPERIVSTQVFAPDGAQVTLSGTQADRDQGARPFISPPLDPNKTYTYRAKATWVDQNGQQQVREKSVDVKAGQQVSIDLNQADANTPAVNDRNRNQDRAE